MELFLELLGFHLFFLAVAIFFIYKYEFADKNQKKLQVIFSAVLPILGPVITIAIYWSDVIKPQKPTDRYIGQSIDECPYTVYWPFQ
jgi:hypothetical protein